MELNVIPNSKVIHEIMTQFDKDKDGKLNYEEFLDVCAELKRRPELDGVFDKFAKSASYIEAADLLRFYRGEQKVLNHNHATFLLLMKTKKKIYRNQT